MDAFELLKNDHDKVSDLFDTIESARGASKRDVFLQIKSELDLHAHVEETIFYPALEKHDETHDITLEGYEEHKIVKELLAELEGMKAVDDQWDAKLKVLKENVEHHVDEEEGEMFDKAREALSQQQIDQLGERMQAEKAAKQGASGSKSAPPKDQKAAPAKGGVLETIAKWVGISGPDEKEASAKGASRTAASKNRSTAARSTKASSGKKTAKKAAKAGTPAKGAKAGKKISATKRTSAKPGKSAKAAKSSKKSSVKSGKKSSAGKKTGGKKAGGKKTGGKKTGGKKRGGR